jgi:hypothetical protein
MNIAPYCFTKLDWRNNLTGMGKEETERCQLLGREMNHIFATQQRAIGFKAETCK